MRTPTSFKIPVPMGFNAPVSIRSSITALILRRTIPRALLYGARTQIYGAPNHMRMRCVARADNQDEQLKNSSKRKPKPNPDSPVDELIDRTKRETEDEFAWATRASSRAKQVAKAQGRSLSVPPLPRKLASRSPPALLPSEQPVKASIVRAEKGFMGPIPAGAEEKLRGDLQRADSSRKVFSLCGDFGLTRVSGPNAVYALHRMADLARQNTLAPIDRTVVARTYCSELVARVVHLATNGGDEGSLGQKDIVSALKSVSLLNGVQLYEHDVDLLFEQSFAGVLQVKGASQMQELLCSLAHSHHRPSPAMCAAVVARLQMAELSKLRPGGAMKLLWALAQLNMATPPLLAALHAWKPSKKKFTSAQLATILWSLSVLQCSGSRPFATLWHELLTRPDASDLPPASLNKIQQTVMTIQLYSPGEAASLLEHADQLRAAAMASWDKQASAKKSVSSYQKRMAVSLINLGVQHRVEALCSGYSMDLALPLHGVAIEADGPSHLFDDNSAAMGPTTMKHRHLKALGWHVMDIPYTEWDMLQGDQQTGYIEERLAELGISVVPTCSTYG